MTVKIEPNAEPIPGYRLIERLGGGGFGEVWKAEAPGGLMKAIKFVYGDLEAADDGDGARANQELKALHRVITVRHSYILSIERFDIIDGQLIIVTELADKTLWDRHKEHRSNGLPGVPREELLKYMEECAEALDLMNEEYQIQHLDIKPQNLFLVHNHIKVADFGLAKDMGDKAAATITGGVTPVYAAPETFDGWLSRFSDQYSLAIVYQEMLTGQRPFAGSTMRQLVLQHLQMAPDLSSLPVADRPIVGRSLNKNHEERYPSCREFVQCLRAATSGVSARPFPSFSAPALQPDLLPGEKTPFVPNETVDVAANETDEDSQVTQGARGHVTSRPAAVAEPEDNVVSLENRPQVLPPRPGNAKVIQETPAVSEKTGGTIPTAAFGQRHGAAVAHPRPGTRSAPEIDPTKGILQPTLILGLGKLGLETLRQVRKLVTQEFGHADALPHVRLLGIDTDPETIQAASHGDPESLLRTYEMLTAKLQRPSHYLKPRDGKESPESWISPKLLFRIPRQPNGAGLRAFGRLAFVDNYRLISRRLEGELQSCASEDTLHEMAGQTDLGLRSKTPRVYVVTNLGGATGSGMFIDAAYILHQLLRKQGFPNAEVVGILLLPSPGKETQRSGALANAYAALTELNHFSTGQMFKARFEATEAQGGARTFTEAGPPFKHCIMLNLPERAPATDEANEVLAEAAQFLFRDLATVMGPALDEVRRPHQQAFHMVGQAHFQTFGMHRLLWPRRQLMQCAARNLCKRLVERWMTKDARAISQDVRQWSLEQWEAMEMRPENVIADHQDRCEKILGQAPDRIFYEAINPLATLLTNGKGPIPPSSDVNVGPVVQVLDHLERLLGLPDECRPPGPQCTEPGTIERALAEASESLAEVCEQKLLEAVVRLIEHPEYRLAGAEESLRQFCITVEQALQSQETLAKELHDRSILVYERIQVLMEIPAVLEETRTKSLWKFGRRNGSDKGSPVDELLDLMKTYAKCRYQSLTLLHVNRLYVCLRGFLSDQIREVGFCRQRLGELAGLVAAPAKDTALPLTKRPPAQEHHLLPEGCKTVDKAIEQLDQQISAEHLVALDERIQALIQKECQGLVQVCAGPAHVVKNLAPAMVRDAEDFLKPFLQGASVADLFITQKGGSADETEEELLRAYDEAIPELAKTTGGKEICVVAIPKDKAGVQLQETLERVLPGAKVVATDRCDEIVFYREQLQLTISDLEQLGQAGRDAYQQRESQDPGTLHCREDIGDWRTSPMSCAAIAR